MLWKEVPEAASFDLTQMARLIDCIGSTGFSQELLNVMSEIVPVAEASGLILGTDMIPRAVGWCGRRADTTVRVQRYVGDFYQFDPTLRSLSRSARPGRSFFGLFRPDNIGHEEYRWTCFEVPDFRRKLSIACSREFGWMIFNLYFSRRAIDDEATVRLAQLGALFISPLVKNQGSSDQHGPPWAPSRRSKDHLIDQLAYRYPNLAPRERHVCAMTMLGNSAERIAAELGIGRNSVLTYRRRAYGKLGINNAATLAVDLLL